MKKTIYNSGPQDLVDNDFFGLSKEEYIEKIIDYLKDDCLNPSTIAKKNWSRALDIKAQST
jgi:hypothetical protein